MDESHQKICVTCNTTDLPRLLEQLREQGYDPCECALQGEANCKEELRELIQRDKLFSLGILVAGVAHELNNPNYFMRLNSELLLKGWPDVLHILDEYYQQHGAFRLGGLDYPDARERIENALRGIHEGSDRIAALVDELKSYAQRQPDDMQEPIDAESVVCSATLLLANLLNTSCRNFNKHIQDSIPMFNGHFQRIEQVLINVLQNACFAVAGCENGRIDLRACADESGQNVVFEIIDNGVGIAGENLNRITDPFYTTRRDEGGTGLGLSVAQSVIHAHGGTISFDSKKGEGTRVRIVLPVTREAY